MSETKPRSDGASATPFIVGIVAMLIVLAVVLYGISKTVTHVANTATSAQPMTGQGGQ